jgi:hypothetical protein
MRIEGMHPYHAFSVNRINYIGCVGIDYEEPSILGLLMERIARAGASIYHLDKNGHMPLCELCEGRSARTLAGEGSLDQDFDMLIFNGLPAHKEMSEERDYPVGRFRFKTCKSASFMKIIRRARHLNQSSSWAMQRLRT